MSLPGANESMPAIQFGISASADPAPTSSRRFLGFATPSTIAGPLVSFFVGGDPAETPLDSAKGWLVVHNDAVMTVLFLVFGVELIAKGIPPFAG